MLFDITPQVEALLLKRWHHLLLLFWRADNLQAFPTSSLFRKPSRSKWATAAFVPVLEAPICSDKSLSPMACSGKEKKEYNTRR